MQVWIDEAELKIGDSLVSKISAAIDKADFVAAILSHNSVRSKWVTKELQLAMTQEIEGRRVKVLPILIERCEVPEFLADKVYADFTDPDDFDGPLSRLLHAPPRRERTPLRGSTTSASLVWTKIAPIVRTLRSSSITYTSSSPPTLPRSGSRSSKLSGSSPGTRCGGMHGSKATMWSCTALPTR